MISLYLRYTGVASIMIRKRFAHRTELFLLVMASLMPLFMMVIWMGIAEDAAMQGFSPTKFATYFALVFLFGEIVSSTATEIVEEDVHSGDINSVMLRPFSVCIYYGLSELAAAIVRTIPILVVIAGVFLISEAGSYVDLKMIPLALAAIVFGFTINFLLYYLAGLLSFWSSQASTADLLLTYMLTLFGGVLAPLSLYPEWMQAVLAWSPFPYIISLPIRIMMGEMSFVAVAEGLLFQCVLILALAFLSGFVWKKGVKQHGAFG